MRPTKIKTNAYIHSEVENVGISKYRNIFYPKCYTTNYSVEVFLVDSNIQNLQKIMKMLVKRYLILLNLLKLKNYQKINKID